jgi:flagellar basal-body rod protein FlgF
LNPEGNTWTYQKQKGMNRGLYTAAGGMLSGQQWLDVVATNLSNANTIGYKRDEVAFEEAMLFQVSTGAGRGKPLGDLQSGPTISNVATVWEAGGNQATGNGLDVAITSAKGMFAVEGPDGIKYTRAGAFKLDGERFITDMNGYRVLDANQRPIQVTDPGVIKISNDGTVQIQDKAFGKVAVWNGEFKKLGSNLYNAQGNTPTLESQPVLTPESIESSNVNVVSTMIEMIQVQRIYELAQRSVMTHDEMTGKLVQAAQPR